jgi:hypothetical protein
MYDFAILAFAAIAAIASVLTVLPLLGFDIRIRGRQTVPPAPTESRRTRKAWFALALALVSLALSAGAFYYFLRPRVVERTVEKPVEKLVPAPCPEPQAPGVKPTPDTNPPRKREHAATNPTPSYQSCPNGICIGGENSGTATVNNYGTPDRHLTGQQKADLGNIVVPSSVKLTVLMTADDEVQIYGNEISEVLKIPPTSVTTGMAWNGAPPQGTTVQIRDDQQPQALKDFGLQLAKILGAPGYLNPTIPAGEVRIVVGHQRRP